MESRWAAITGRHEFEELCFVTHFLNEKDTFVDVGANVGIFAVLASGVVRAKTIAIEPIPETHMKLCENVRLNRLEELVNPMNVGAGDVGCTARMTSALDTENHALSAGNNGSASVDVPQHTLDELLDGVRPRVIKVDVEGYEGQVIKGGREILSQDSLSAVMVELNGNCRRYATSPDTIHDDICTHGLTPVAFNPLTRKLTTLKDRNRRSVNTIYVRDPEEASARLEESQPLTIFGKET